MIAMCNLYRILRFIDRYDPYHPGRKLRRVRRTLILCALLLTGCAYPQSAVYIPTGNPITDALASALVQEAATAVAREVVNGRAPYLLAALPGVGPSWDYECRNIRRARGVNFCEDEGSW